MMILLFLACGAECPEGQIREEGLCVDYEAGEPVQAPSAWHPAPGRRWQWQLSGTPDLSFDVEMFDLDLFDTPDETIAQLHADGRVLICYFSAGTLEDWREDAGSFPERAVGRALPEWAGERWLDLTDAEVREALARRLDRAVERGCDGVEPDNVDGYANNNGVNLTATEQLAANRWLADEAHERGLSVGLKNDLDQVEALLPWFDWALNEECAAYQECERLSAFTDADKAAFHVEYVDDWSESGALAARVCEAGERLDTLIKLPELGPERLACD